MTSPYFRPQLKPTLWFVPAFVLLIGLGVWQVQRLHWKEALIAEVGRNMNIKPIRLGDGGKLFEENETNYLHVTLRGRFDNMKERYVYGIGADSTPVYHILVPFITDHNEFYLVDRGIVPPNLLNPITRPAGILHGPTTVTGIWRWAETPGAFTPSPDIAHRIWFFRDVTAIAKSDGLKLEQNGLIEADAMPNPGGWPKGGQTVVDFPNNHLQYALTWFGLAAALLAVYLYYHRSLGRLGWS